MKVKGWQIAVIVLGFIAAGVSIAMMFNSNEPVLSHEYHAIDVESGTIFRIDSLKYILTAPAPHPETGRLSLITVSRDENGHWFVSDRNRSLLPRLQSDIKNTSIDPDTGDLKVDPKPPIDYQRK